MKIIGVTFDDSKKITYFTYNEPITIGYNVIVEKDNGLFLGVVSTDLHDIDETKLNVEIGRIIRLASKDEYKKYLENKKQEPFIISKCKKIIKKYSLDMKIVDAKFTIDRDQLIIRFYADDRVDFRNLAKDLAVVYKTRIELRQIGVRDKAKIVDGIGVCGQKLCCSRFLNNFEPVSIAMAKNQNLALNPSKINGICGRLMCCLKYEDDCYSSLKKNIPSVGKIVTIDGKKGKVISCNILKSKYKIQFEDGSITEVSSNESN